MLCRPASGILRCLCGGVRVRQQANSNSGRSHRAPGYPSSTAALPNHAVHPSRPPRQGTKVTFPGKGDERPGQPPADLQFVVDEAPHARFTRRGNDLHYTGTRAALQRPGRAGGSMRARTLTRAACGGSPQPDAPELRGRQRLMASCMARAHASTPWSCAPPHAHVSPPALHAQPRCRWSPHCAAGAWRSTPSTAAASTWRCRCP